MQVHCPPHCPHTYLVLASHFIPTLALWFERYGLLQTASEAGQQSLHRRQYAVLLAVESAGDRLR